MERVGGDVMGVMCFNGRKSPNIISSLKQWCTSKILRREIKLPQIHWCSDTNTHTNRYTLSGHFCGECKMHLLHFLPSIDRPQFAALLKDRVRPFRTWVSRVFVFSCTHPAVNNNALRQYTKIGAAGHQHPLIAPFSHSTHTVGANSLSLRSELSNITLPLFHPKINGNTRSTERGGWGKISKNLEPLFGQFIYSTFATFWRALLLVRSAPSAIAHCRARSTCHR